MPPSDGPVVIDTNLLVLLIVGSASKRYISRHKRLGSYTVDDFELLGLLLSQFSEIVLLPHIVSEVSSIARQIDNPARREIQMVLRTLIETCTEFPAPSISGAQRGEFSELGVTDAVILHVCTMSFAGTAPTLLTSDSKLANTALSLGCSVIDYRDEFQAT